MPTPPGPSVTVLLERARAGDRDALAALLPLVYDELRRIARMQMRRERPGQTIDATGLVHEAGLRLSGASHLSPHNRAHFLGIAANALLVTNTAAAAATITWVLASYLHHGKVSVVGASCVDLTAESLEVVV